MKLYKIKYETYVCAILSEKHDVKEFLKGKNPDKYSVETFEGTIHTLKDVK